MAMSGTYDHCVLGSIAGYVQEFEVQLLAMCLAPQSTVCCRQHVFSSLRSASWPCLAPPYVRRGSGVRFLAMSGISVQRMFGQCCRQDVFSSLRPGSWPCLAPPYVQGGGGGLGSGCPGHREGRCVLRLDSNVVSIVGETFPRSMGDWAVGNWKVYRTALGLS